MFDQENFSIKLKHTLQIRLSKNLENHVDTTLFEVGVACFVVDGADTWCSTFFTSRCYLFRLTDDIEIFCDAIVVCLEVF